MATINIESTESATHNANLERVLRAAIVDGYHACDETVPAQDDPPRGGCRCWVEEAKVLINFAVEE